ncbi:Uncharacterised protein [Mycobacterium tuberculosis]|nr:Uncharacterised protein [Mycobacterium tuberculosis]SGO21829.1 Uncharacterised protein [Mycobacterium tuberculosis]
MGGTRRSPSLANSRSMRTRSRTARTVGAILPSLEGRSRRAQPRRCRVDGSGGGSHGGATTGASSGVSL